MSTTITEAKQVADMATATQTHLETMLIPGSVLVETVNTPKSTTLDAFCVYFLAWLKANKKIELKDNGVISIWNADVNGYMDISAEGATGSENINMDNV